MRKHKHHYDFLCFWNRLLTNLVGSYHPTGQECGRYIKAWTRNRILSSKLACSPLHPASPFIPPLFFYSEWVLVLSTYPSHWNLDSCSYESFPYLQSKSYLGNDQLIGEFLKRINFPVLGSPNRLNPRCVTQSSVSSIPHFREKGKIASVSGKEEELSRSASG